MKGIYRQRVACDLRITCKGGSLDCHRFVVAAQSTFLRRILSHHPDTDDVAVVVLPDVPLSDMENLLKLLYLGELVAYGVVVGKIKYLMERVLFYDAAIPWCGAGYQTDGSPRAFMYVKCQFSSIFFT